MIVSASRRTDLPGCYLPWLLARLAAGRCRVVNPYNARQQRVVSLQPDEVDAIVFWTRDPGRLAGALPRLAELGHARTMALVTITGMDRALEPQVPATGTALAGFLELSSRYGDPARTCWRYDPILLGPADTPDHHRRRFERLARRLEGSTRRVIVSLLAPYRKTLHGLERARRAGHAGAVAPAPDDAEVRLLLHDLAAMARACGMQLQGCALPKCRDDEGVPAGRCIDPELLAALFPARRFDLRKDPGQRGGCRCAPSVDLGAMDTCRHGCVYCYATRSPEIAAARAQRHDPAGEALLAAPVSDDGQGTLDLDGSGRG